MVGTVECILAFRVRCPPAYPPAYPLSMSIDPVLGFVLKARRAVAVQGELSTMDNGWTPLLVILLNGGGGDGTVCACLQQNLTVSTMV